MQLSPGRDTTAAAAGRAPRILVVDDDCDTVHTLAAVLRLEGYEVTERFGGAEGIEAEELLAPDVVLLDVGMPRVTGYEAARRIRQRHAASGGKGPLLIAITCYQLPSDKILAKLCGFDHHIGKPFDTRALLRLLPKKPD
jgi:CheY-like chemotaxis protein